MPGYMDVPYADKLVQGTDAELADRHVAHTERYGIPIAMDLEYADQLLSRACGPVSGGGRPTYIKSNKDQ